MRACMVARCAGFSVSLVGAGWSVRDSLLLMPQPCRQHAQAIVADRLMCADGRLHRVATDSSGPLRGGPSDRQQVLQTAACPTGATELSRTGCSSPSADARTVAGEMAAPAVGLAVAEPRSATESDRPSTCIGSVRTPSASADGPRLSFDPRWIGGLPGASFLQVEAHARDGSRRGRTTQTPRALALIDSFSGRRSSCGDVPSGSGEPQRTGPEPWSAPSRTGAPPSTPSECRGGRSPPGPTA